MMICLIFYILWWCNLEKKKIDCLEKRLEYLNTGKLQSECTTTMMATFQFKKHQEVRFVEPGTDFLMPETQDIIWRYGKILFKINKKYGATSYMIEEHINKNKLKISEYLVFEVH